MNTGFGPFYDGLAHLFVTPEDLLPVVALALLGGLLGPRFGRAILFTLPLAWIGGNLTGGLMSASFTLSLVSASLTIVLGILVAANKPLPLLLIVGLAAFLGWLHGSLNRIDQAQAHPLILLSVGVATALFVIVSLFAGQVSRLRVPWLRVAVRVGGSWIAAIGLLMLGWLVRGA